MQLPSAYALLHHLRTYPSGWAYVVADGEILSREAVLENLRLITRSMRECRDFPCHTQWRVEHALELVDSVHVVCAHTHEEL